MFLIVKFDLLIFVERKSENFLSRRFYRSCTHFLHNSLKIHESSGITYYNLFTDKFFLPPERVADQRSAGCPSERKQGFVKEAFRACRACRERKRFRGCFSRGDIAAVDSPTTKAPPEPSHEWSFQNIDVLL
jgi:hypothetical protein